MPVLASFDGTGYHDATGPRNATLAEYAQATRMQPLALMSSRPPRQMRQREFPINADLGFNPGWNRLMVASD
jgi:hypothetical protein